MDRIYLDNNATTFCAEEVIDVMAKTARMRVANPASQHQFGRDARRCINEASEVILQSVNAKRTGMNADQLVLCSGGTEANNLAVLGLPDSIEGSIVVSTLEHPSVLDAAELAQKRGRKVEYIPANQDGLIDLDWLKARLQQTTLPVACVAVMAANNETGVIQPYQQVGELCRSKNIRYHIDAVQCLGKIDFNFQSSLADSVTICAHKIHGPIGIGALIHRAEVYFDPIIVGGKQQAAIRAGTESVMLPAGFAQAILRLAANPDRVANMRRLRDRFESLLVSQCGAEEFEITIIGENAPRLPNTTCISFANHSRQALQMAFDFAGIACSTGSACESGSATPSHVLLAMGLPEEIVQSALRFSLSEFTTQFEVDEAVSRIVRCLRKKKIVS